MTNVNDKQIKDFTTDDYFKFINLKKIEIEKFNKKLVIHYKKNINTNVYKRVITKLANGKYNVTTYYRENKINKTFVSKIEFNKEQIEELIQAYLDEFNFEKSVFYK